MLLQRKREKFMDLNALEKQIREFRGQREWMQFHNPKNLAISISLEAAELLEHFQWKTPEESEAHARVAKLAISEEIADITVYLIELCDNLEIDLESAILSKLAKNAEKYPVAKAKGSAKRYHELGTSNFTIRVISANPHQETSTAWRAGRLVVAMEGCSVPSIIAALTSLEHETTPKGVGDPARWLTHFAGLESIESGKGIEPWIEILHAGKVVRSKTAYRELLRHTK
jgi:dCTP diphosphatase